MITACNRCCSQQLGHLSKRETNCRSCHKHCFSLCVECAAACMHRILQVLHGEGGGGRWGDSWQCELWLNCRRECTERLETVGVKKTPAPSSISHTAPAMICFSDIPLCIVDDQYSFPSVFLFHKPFSHHILPSVTEDAPPLSDETHCIW